ncbi:formate dehydrogenase subunit delta [Hyphomicrobium sp. B1]|jgi:formate dehydrogenase subunit delta|uniref:formate dehydrogenase subunit delta n=1 Tax=unclassified Hyphomicrobium TaxID=2619925 RepID=UPI00391A8B03
MQSSDIIRMTNQIAAYFESYPKQEAIDGIAMHIHNFWEPRMRNELKSYIDAGGKDLSPLFLEAMAAYYKGPKSPVKQAVVQNKDKVAPKGAMPSTASGGGDAG